MSATCLHMTKEIYFPTPVNFGHCTPLSQMANVQGFGQKFTEKIIAIGLVV